MVGPETPIWWFEPSLSGELSSTVDRPSMTTTGDCASFVGSGGTSAVPLNFPEANKAFALGAETTLRRNRVTDPRSGGG